MQDNLYNIVNDYTSFLVIDKKIKIPYCIVEKKVNSNNTLGPGRTTKFSNYAGKGSPEQIRLALIEKAKKENFDLSIKTGKEITQFMIHQGIGVDCSGFVYNILNAYLKSTKNVSLDTLILRFPGILGKLERFLFSQNRVRRCSAEVLTNELNTFKILKTNDIHLGDMIRLTHPNWKGKHIAIVVEVTKKYLMYAHSSEYTKESGPHLAKIRVLSPHEGLEKQEWLEKTRDGKNYGSDTYLPIRGDSVRRLKYYES